MLIYGFNEACNNIAISYLKVGDESTSAIRFWITVKGDLRHLSYILFNLQTLGKEFKKVDCYFTWALLLNHI